MRKTGEKLIAGEIDFKTWQVMREVLIAPGQPRPLLARRRGSSGRCRAPAARSPTFSPMTRPSASSKTSGEISAPASPMAWSRPRPATRRPPGGGLIPLIALGIPGSAVDAILMASLMVHGISVGPRLIMDNADLVYGMFIAMAVVQPDDAGRLRALDAVLPAGRRSPEMGRSCRSVLVCCVVGSFALNNRVTDLYLLGFIGSGRLRPEGARLSAGAAGARRDPRTDRRDQPAPGADDRWRLDRSS